MPNGRQWTYTPGQPQQQQSMMPLMAMLMQFLERRRERKERQAERRERMAWQERMFGLKETKAERAKREARKEEITMGLAGELPKIPEPTKAPELTPEEERALANLRATVGAGVAGAFLPKPGEPPVRAAEVGLGAAVPKEERALRGLLEKRVPGMEALLDYVRGATREATALEKQLPTELAGVRAAGVREAGRGLAAAPYGMLPEAMAGLPPGYFEQPFPIESLIKELTKPREERGALERELGILGGMRYR